MRYSLAAMSLAAVSLAVIVSSPGSARAATELPAWLAGTWAMESGAAWADEVWTSSRGGMMIGMGRVGFGAEVESSQAKRIERRPGGQIVLVVQAKGAAAADFPLAVSGVNSAEFTNPDHAFPQRIRYWREGQLLMREASKMDGSEAVRMNFRPVETAPKD